MIGDRGWEWDHEKNTNNQKAHGVSFEEALEALTDSLSSNREDIDHSFYERRSNTVGMTHGGRLLFVVHTWNESGGKERIISARDATRRERIDHESGNF